MLTSRLEIDVTGALSDSITGGRPTRIHVRVFAEPSAFPTGRPPALIVCLNGGSYDWRYFHALVPGYPGYSMAEHLAARGDVIVVPDHLGIGESSRPARQRSMTNDVVAAANHAALAEIFERARTGSLVSGLPALPRFRRVGAGHSMGGMQTIVQQAIHSSYDQIAVLGYTALGVHLHVGGSLVPGHRELDPNAADYWRADRAMLRGTFHWEDVPPAVLAADDELLVEVPYVLSTQSIQRGIVASEARRIRVPVYLCFGERDVSPDPYAEPACYAASRDVTLHILPRSGHCQNFASTRAEMWDRIHAWIPSVHGES